jgi:hypothetical protein
MQTVRQIANVCLAEKFRLQRKHVTAELAKGRERARLWGLLVDWYPATRTTK